MRWRVEKGDVLGWTPSNILWLCDMFHHVKQTLYPGVSNTAQPFYHPFLNCTYWPVLCIFNNWNIIMFTNKNRSNEFFDEIRKVVLYGISYIMAYLVQRGKYGVISLTYPTMMDYCVVKFLPDTVMLQEDNTTDGEVLKTGEISIISEYLSIMTTKDKSILEFKKSTDRNCINNHNTLRCLVNGKHIYSPLKCGIYFFVLGSSIINFYICWSGEQFWYQFKKSLSGILVDFSHLCEVCITISYFCILRFLVSKDVM